MDKEQVKKIIEEQLNKRDSFGILVAGFILFFSLIFFVAVIFNPFQPHKTHDSIKEWEIDEVGAQLMVTYEICDKDDPNLWGEAECNKNWEKPCITNIHWVRPGEEKEFSELEKCK
jgi:hypothetical protein